MSLRHAALGLLADRPGSGYDLLKRFETAMGNVWSATQSQLYGELNKLEREQLIRVAAAGPRGRKEYTITDAGRAELRDWLLHPSPPSPRNEAMLRVYFLGSLTGEQARDYLRAQGAVARQRVEDLTELEAAVDWDARDDSVFGRLVLEWGKRFSVLQQEWAEWAVREIRNR